MLDIILRIVNDLSRCVFRLRKHHRVMGRYVIDIHECIISVALDLGYKLKICQNGICIHEHLRYTRRFGRIDHSLRCCKLFGSSRACKAAVRLIVVSLIVYTVLEEERTYLKQAVAEEISLPHRLLLCGKIRININKSSLCYVSVDPLVTFSRESIKVRNPLISTERRIANSHLEAVISEKYRKNGKRFVVFFDQGLIRNSTDLLGSILVTAKQSRSRILSMRAE